MYTIFIYSGIDELRKIQASREIFPFKFVETKELLEYRFVHWDVVNEPFVHYVVEKGSDIRPDDPSGCIFSGKLTHDIGVSIVRRSAFSGKETLFVCRCFCDWVKGIGI